MADIPYSAPVVAWRAWSFRRQVLDSEPGSHRAGFRLQALWRDNISPLEWDPGKYQHAHCAVRGLRTHQRGGTPNPACHCGYSAVTTKEDLVWDLCGRRLDRVVLGEVNLWGRVLQEPWLRAQSAYPRSLYVITDRWATGDAHLIASDLSVYETPVHLTTWNAFRAL